MALYICNKVIKLFACDDCAVTSYHSVYLFVEKVG